MCEDYRGGGDDRSRARRGRPGRRTIDCPVLALWGTHGALPRFYGDVLAVWREWASDLRGRGVEASHFLAEDAPEEVAGELAEFFGGERAYRRRIAHSITGSLTAWGRYWLASIAARTWAPGTTTRRPRLEALDPGAGGLLGGHPGRAWGRPSRTTGRWPPPSRRRPRTRSRPGPGASAVTVTPAPLSSSCSASEKVSM